MDKRTAEKMLDSMVDEASQREGERGMGYCHGTAKAFLIMKRSQSLDAGIKLITAAKDKEIENLSEARKEKDTSTDIWLEGLIEALEYILKKLNS